LIGAIARRWTSRDVQLPPRPQRRARDQRKLEGAALLLGTALAILDQDAVERASRELRYPFVADSGYFFKAGTIEALDADVAPSDAKLCPSDAEAELDPQAGQDVPR